LLAHVADLAGEIEVADADHLAETREHSDLFERRLHAFGGAPSSLEGLCAAARRPQRAAFFQAHPATPGKHAAFLYAVEHLEIAAYEQLERVAARAGDGVTAALAERIIDDERAAAARIAGRFRVAAHASLEAVGAPTPGLRDVILLVHRFVGVAGQLPAPLRVDHACRCSVGRRRGVARRLIRVVCGLSLLVFCGFGHENPSIAGARSPTEPGCHRSRRPLQP
jgi:ferritin-like metal-binding protein YciE